MIPQVNITDVVAKDVVTSLRSPCANNAEVKLGYSQSSPSTLGQVLVFPSVADPVIAPGSGVVTLIARKPNNWGHSAGELDVYQTLEVTIDHGAGVSTVMHGLLTTTVITGQAVTRGDQVGSLRTTEMFLKFVYLGNPCDLASLSQNFRGYDGGKVIGKSRMLRGGDDKSSFVDGSSVSYVSGEIRYIVDVNCALSPLLVSIDFNGYGTTSGSAAVGLSSLDYWNTYANPYVPPRDYSACAVVVPGPVLFAGSGGDTFE